MNEGESAGGGHQGSNPAPPAVPDRISTTTITSSNRIINTNNLKSASSTTPLSLAITADEQNSASLGEACTSPVPRSFQQAFAQHSLQPLPTTTTSTTEQQEQLQQQSLTHMPQTSSNRLTSSVTPATTTAPTIRTDSSFVTAATNISDPSINTPLIKRKILDDIHSTAGGEITVLAPNICIVGSLLPTSHSHNCSLNKPSIATTDSNKLKNNPQALKKLILEQKYLRLRSLKEKHSENVAELFYLQTGGNMMDYPTWRKKPPTPQFITYSNAYRLDQLVSDERTSAPNTPNTTDIHTQQQQQPHQTADSIATIIGVVGHSQQPQQQQATQQTNTQSQANFSTTSSSTINNNNSLMVTTHGRTNIINGNNNNGCGNINSPAGTVSIAATHYGAAGIQSTILPTTTDASGNILPPQGAEIKIPAVGATPVAVSTKLPAAVQQLSQQGGTPLIPCSTAQGTTTLRRNGNSVIASNTPPPLYSPTPSGLLVPASSVNGSTVASASTTAANSAQEFSYKAKQEVDVMRRIMELQREGLWTEKRLPKQLEPARPKAHWDYLLEEMVWLAADFAQERKWKKAAAKKCAKMVQKYFQDKANAAQKAEKAQEAHLKRVAAFIAKEVKMFWSNVEKLVEYKHHTKLEEKRKKALDQHLSFIVDQTEKFSQQLAEGMNKSLVDASANPSINSSRISSPKRDNTDEEFRPESTSDDDEETIAKAEEEEAMDVDAEIAALEKESQMELNDVIKDLPKGYLENRDKILLEEQKQNHLKENDEGSTDSDDGEFIVNETSEDDENTISKQEAEEMDIDHQKEIDELEADNDLTVVELLARYTSTNLDNTDVEEKPKKSEDSKKMEIDDGSNGDDENEETIVKPSRDSDDESTADEESDDQDSEDEGDDLEEEGDEENTPEEEEADGLKSLFEDANVNSKDDMIKDAAALAESLQPKGNTLSSTNVVTPVPFLLKHTLREYQHIGLDWLVTMNERKLNGILADEMGLGKTIQTIALLAHLACVKGNWGPHLIVVPSSVMLNWEMEFKKWCPGFKILTYYGVQKERKMKRVGWTKPNAFHVCITSYKLVVQDQQSFRRKKWKYLILDEAQNIKNFKSQRWQLLLNFSTERRLLLTGTPLQNDLMELWSLMHFLMPYVFSSHREFKEWFSNPMTGMIEGNLEYNDQLIQRLHKVIRPFLLRRLKKEVEKQMPKKYEHVIMCRLSNRQRYLYDDFMSRAKTKETLQTGNLLSVINVLMQLRKVCNHPNMFEVRPTMSPFQMEGITYETSRLVCDLLDYDPFMQINLHTLNLLLIELELTLTAYVSHKSRLLAAPRKLIEEIDTAPQLPPRCPTGKYRFHVRVRDPKVQQNLRTHSSQAVRVGASPTMKTEGNKLVPVCGPASVDSSQSRINKRINHVINPLGQPKFGVIIPNLTTTTVTRSQVSNSNNSSTNTDDMGPTPAKIQKIGETAKSSTVNNSSGDAKLYIKAAKSIKDETALVSALVRQVKSNTSTRLSIYNNAEFKTEPSEIDDNCSELDSVYKMTEIFQQRKEKRFARLKLMATVNKRRTEATPIYGADCRESLEQCLNTNHKVRYSTWHTRSYSNCCTAMARFSDNWTLNRIIKSYEKRCENLKQIFNNFVIYVPSVCAPRLRFYVRNLTSTNRLQQLETENTIQREMSTKLSILHPIISAMTTQFPDPRLIQYDCGKLQTLDRLLKQLKGDHHRILIFTQMTKMLDVLEAFLNYHGHIYLRLDGATKVEQRQILMERFNSDKRIFCFILSTRSGGVGINLTGADTVIFYDSDWNPTMDAQAQDRCHRIGQTRDVHIYRLVSEKTIEVNILKKANQKRMLSDMAIEGGNFTTSYFKSSTIKDLFNIDSQQQAVDSTTIAMATNASSCTQYQQEVSNSEMMVGGAMEIDLEKQSLKAFENALAAAEDEQDVQAAKTAKAEAAADLAEFDENIPLDETMATEGACNVELSKADLEMQNLVKQLSPIERYAMRFVEETGAAWTAEQLRAAEEEIEAQKREWEANRLAALQKEEEMLKQEAETAEELLTYSRKDATNQVNKSSNYKTNNRQRAKLDRKSSKRTGGRIRNRGTQNQKLLTKRRGRQPACRLSTRQQTQKQKQTIGSSRRRAGRKSKNSRQVRNANENEEEEEEEEDAKDEDEDVDEDEDEGKEESEEQVTANEEESSTSISEEGSGEEDEKRAEKRVGLVDSNEEVNDESEANESASDQEFDNNTSTSRGGNRRLKRRTIDSGSLNRRRTIAAKNSRRAIDEESKNTKSSTKTIRKTTRTSMAAAAIATMPTEIDVKQNAKKNVSSKRKLVPNALEKAENIVNKSNKSSTGVKNQKLLSFATKRLEQKRKEKQKLYQKETVSETRMTLKRKANVTQIGRKAKRRAVGIRKSPRKLKQPEIEIESEDDSKDNSDEGRRNVVEDSRSVDCNSDMLSQQVDEENKIRSEEDVNTNSTDEEDERQKLVRTKTHVKAKMPSVRGRGGGGKTIQNSISRIDSTAECSDDNGGGASAQLSDDENDKSSCLNLIDQETGNSSSMDIWNAHTQMLDTTTNSTYYNVSEESESDENQTLVNMNSASRRTPAPNGKTNSTNTRSNLQSTDGGDIDNHTPRTRSRGSVKINLWTLDESPILASLRSGTAKQARKESTGSNYVEENSDNANKDPLTCISTPLRSSSVKRTAKNDNTIAGTQSLQRWLIRTPRSDAGVIGEYNDISTTNGPKNNS